MNEIISQAPEKGTGINIIKEKTDLRVVEIPVGVLENMKNWIKAELTRFKFGLMVSSGSITLGLERLITEIVPKGSFNDIAFWFYLCFLFFGVVFMFSGYSAEKYMGNIIDEYLPREDV